MMESDSTLRIGSNATIQIVSYDRRQGGLYSSDDD